MAVGDERAHAELLSEGAGLLVMDRGQLDLRGLVPCCDVAEQAQSIGLGATFLALTKECQCILRERAPPSGGRPAGGASPKWR